MKPLSLLVAVVALLLVAGCGGTTADQCSPSASCAGGGSLEACCNSRQCSYKASDGTVFPCAGTNCGAAAGQAVDWCAVH